MKKIKNFFIPSGSIGYNASMWAFTFLTLVATIIIPFIVPEISHGTVGTNTTASTTTVPQPSGFLQLIGDFVWIITFIIGSISSWLLLTSFALLIDRVFSLHILGAYIQKRMPRYIVILIGIYVVMGILIRRDIYSSSSVFGVLETQAGGMILGSILGWSMSSLSVQSATNKSRRIRKREPTDDEKAGWYLSFPLMLAWMIGLITLFVS
jgi:hypothetical protein